MFFWKANESRNGLYESTEVILVGSEGISGSRELSLSPVGVASGSYLIPTLVL